MSSQLQSKATARFRAKMLVLPLCVALFLSWGCTKPVVLSSPEEARTRGHHMPLRMTKLEREQQRQALEAGGYTTTSIGATIQAPAPSQAPRQASAPTTGSNQQNRSGKPVSHIQGL